MAITQETLRMMEQQPKSGKKLNPLELRVAAGIETQDDMSDLIKVSRSTIAAAERSVARGRAISKKTAMKYANAIKAKGVTEYNGVPVDWQNIDWLIEE